MISAELFEHLERCFRAMRASAKAFGGVQIILSGDFFQLPPIPNKFNYNSNNSNFSKRKSVSEQSKTPFLNRGLLFQSPAFQRCAFESFLLRKVFRQEDEHFVSILNNIRIGSSAGEQALNDLVRCCSRPLSMKGGEVKPTRLFSRNSVVDEKNSEEMMKCPPPDRIYTSNDWVEPSTTGSTSDQDHHMKKRFLEQSEFFKDCLAAKVTTIRLDSQVMLLKNMDLDSKKMLVNGSRGVVKKFVKRKNYLKELQDEVDKNKNVCWLTDEWIYHDFLHS